MLSKLPQFERSLACFLRTRVWGGYSDTDGLLLTFPLLSDGVGINDDDNYAHNDNNVLGGGYGYDFDYDDHNEMLSLIHI